MAREDRGYITDLAARLLYVVGPSGAGKDTVIQTARQRCPLDARVAFSHRYITKPPHLRGENYIYLRDAEFDLRLRTGCFAFHWAANRYRYAVGIEINSWLSAGLDVVVSGSRGHLPEVRAHYPGVRVIAITAPPATLEMRLKDRARERPDEISERLARGARLTLERSEVDYEIVNDTTPEKAGAEFLFILSQR